MSPLTFSIGLIVDCEFSHESTMLHAIRILELEMDSSNTQTILTLPCGSGTAAPQTNEKGSRKNVK